MKIRADEHVSPEIVRAVREMALSEGWEITSVLEAGQGGSTDEHWITQFAAEGGQVILSADTDFLAKPPQVQAVFQTGIRVIHLPQKWAMAKCHLQAAHILMWWKRIEEKITTMKERECYRPPWNVTDSGELMKVDVDFAKAQKKLKQAAKKQSGK